MSLIGKFVVEYIHCVVLYLELSYHLQRVSTGARADSSARGEQTTRSSSLYNRRACGGPLDLSWSGDVAPKA